MIGGDYRMDLMWQGPCLLAWLIFSYTTSKFFGLLGYEEGQQEGGEREGVSYGFIDSAMYQDME